MVISSKLGSRRQPLLRFNRSHFRTPRDFLPKRRVFRLLVLCLACFGILPPVFFHFRLRSFRQMQLEKCNWLINPPLVCAHGGDSSKAFPNTMAAFNVALHSQVDCIEIDVSRSSDGVLFALHDRELQLITGNSSSRVGLMSKKQIQELDLSHQSALQLDGQKVPTVEDALMMVSTSVRRVILDAKVGPPLHERGLARDILSVVRRTKCENCVVWAKSDNLIRDLIKLSSDVAVGYIVMKDYSTGATSNLLRMRKASVVGVYHPLIDKRIMTILHWATKKVYAWTVDDGDSMRKMLIEDVDAVVTSNPTRLQHLMQELRTECLQEGFSLSV